MSENYVVRFSVHADAGEESFLNLYANFLLVT